jgi:LacI family transcriptional regulator
MGKRQTIGFVVPDISNEFFSALINQVEEVVSKQDFMLLVVNTRENRDKEQKQLRRLTSGLVDGLILASAFDDYRTIEECIPARFPVVFLDRKPQNCPCDTIVISSYDAVYQSVENLIHRGHCKIGCVTGTLHISTLDERLQAFRDCLKDNGIEIDERVILQVDITENTTPHLAVYFDNDITAVVFMNNTITIEAFGYLVNNGIMQKRDMDIAGYSDEDWHSYAIKYMDLITQPVADMGAIAGSLILQRINNPEIPPREIVLKAGYIHKTG